MEPTSTPEPAAKRAWTFVAAWIGGISLVLGFIGAITGTFAKIEDHFHGNAELNSQMAVAQSQSAQGDYATAVASYAAILKANPLYRPALDQQLHTTMLWVEDFHAYMKPGEDDPGPATAAQLDQIVAILDAGLVGATGSHAADVQAHLGWAHWLNQHIASREFGPAAENNLRAALATDPNNVYANAMLGNWLLQNGGDLHQALALFHTALATGNARPLVRSLQLGGLISLQSDAAGVELFRAASDMRSHNEPLDSDNKGRILFLCFGPSMDDQVRITQSLSAVPPADAQQTYIWLDDRPREGDEAAYQALTRDFISANLLEIAGQRPQALEKYRSLQQSLKTRHAGDMQNLVNAAIQRLSAN